MMIGFSAAKVEKKLENPFFFRQKMPFGG